jgi:membrane-bound lytic murein transglycosylase MltF
LSTAGFTGKGSGLLHVTQGDLVYDLDLLASGEEGIAACRVNEKFKAVAIPVNCSGSINKPSDVVCELNQKKLLSTLAAQAKVEAKRKIDKEVDLALDKHLDQNIDKYIEKDSELSKQLKDSFRRLFK